MTQQKKFVLLKNCSTSMYSLCGSSKDCIAEKLEIGIFLNLSRVILSVRRRKRVHPATLPVGRSPADVVKRRLS